MTIEKSEKWIHISNEDMRSLRRVLGNFCGCGFRVAAFYSEPIEE